MKITIPKDLGSELKVIPEGPCRAAIEGISLGKSKTDQPKATVRYVCLTELYPKGAPESSIGERILETFSLQPQAIWRLNDLFKEATGENLPQGDYEDTEFQEILEEALKGTEWNLLLATEIYDGREQTKVQERTKVFQMEDRSSPIPF